MASLFSDGAEESVMEMERAADAAADLPPRANPDFIGHEEVERALLKGCLAGRLPHALALAGPPGIGKATLAFRLARFLFHSADGSGQGLFGDAVPPASLHVAAEHAVFRRVASGGHADLLTIEREFDEKKGRQQKEIPVEALRRIHPFLRLTAAEGGWRVVIVDGAEHLTVPSQNALLKILEEPPEKTVLILTVTQVGVLLPTIRSRCRVLQMEPLPEKILAQLLGKMLPGLDAAQEKTLVGLGEGSIGQALQLHREGGVALHEELLRLVADFPALDMVAVHEWAEKLGRYGAEQSYATVMELINGWCRRLALAEARGAALSTAVPGAPDAFERLAAACPRGHFARAWEKIAQLTEQAEGYNLDKRQAIIGAFQALQRPDWQGLAV